MKGNPESRICAFCGSTYKPNTNWQKFCSLKCKDKSRYPKRKPSIMDSNKKHRLEHPEIHRQYSRNYYVKNKLKVLNKTSKYQAEHPEMAKEANRNFVARIRFKILTHYGDSPPRCDCCGETALEFLTIDHINGGGTKQRRIQFKNNSKMFYTWLIKNNFPPL